jgi:hypothetical protein
MQFTKGLSVSATGGDRSKAYHHSHTACYSQREIDRRKSLQYLCGRSEASSGVPVSRICRSSGPRPEMAHSPGAPQDFKGPHSINTEET